MTSEIRHMMPLDEAIQWVNRWRNRHFQKPLGTKDKALITLAHEVQRLNSLIDQLSRKEQQRIRGDQEWPTP